MTEPLILRVLAAAALGMACAVASADGMPEDPQAFSAEPSVGKRARRPMPVRPARQEPPRADRDPLAVDPEIAVRAEPPKALDLPGVMKLEGANAALLDPTRVREVHWRNRGIVTVWVSATQVNRIQLPFPNPRVITTAAVAINKRAASNNVYVHYEGEPVPEQVWFEPAGESAVSIGLQLVPKRIPAQDIVVLDDTVQGSAGRARRAGADNEYLSRVQALMEQAALGASPAGFAEVELQIPVLAVNGLTVKGLRRLSGRGEDLYVYEIGNPTDAVREVREEEFDGPAVLAVSILPRTTLKPGDRAVLVVLAAKREVGTALGMTLGAGDGH